MNLRVMKNGIWATIQGEGKLIGTPSVFLRVAGCNLRCTWCDTPHSLPDYDPAKGFLPVITNKAENLTVREVADRIEILTNYSLDHVVITGGEPTLHIPELKALGELLGRDVHVTVESNCTLPPLGLAWHTDLASLSPKVFHWRGKHKSIVHAYKAWARSTDVQLKIVVASLEDIRVAAQMISELSYHVEPVWAGLQIESSWLRNGWLEKEHRPALFEFLASHNIRLMAQMHPILKVA